MHTNIGEINYTFTCKVTLSQFFVFYGLPTKMKYESCPSTLLTVFLNKVMLLLIKHTQRVHR